MMTAMRVPVLVLWASRFDEAAAAIFVTEFRKAGLYTKLVGLDSTNAAGLHGLALVSDITLEQALPLAAIAACVVLPATATGLQLLMNDPRCQEFLEHVGQRETAMIVRPVGGAGLPGQIRASTVMYPEGSALVEFVRRLAGGFQSNESYHRSPPRCDSSFNLQAAPRLVAL